MRRKEKLPELLAPAGSPEALRAAIAAGADAVYLGGKKFGARAYAKNFTDDELSYAIKLAHLWGVRIYVTLNTLIYDKEMDEAVEYAKSLHSMGIDALIVADLGLVKRLSLEVPELELHASTQMGAHNSEGVNFAHALGCKRVVLARECSASDIRTIVGSSDAECEVFLHGALCVCHSGQCLFSSMVGGRSGNRGECAQPCRLPYNNGKYHLSLRDLSLSEHIEELIGSGVASLKIEGRMKSPEYVYEVTRIYRTLLDGGRSSNAAERQRLYDIFSRGGFTDGYFTGKLARGMTGTRGEGDKQATREVELGCIDCARYPITATATFAPGKRAEVTLSATVRPRWESRGANGETVEKTLSATAYGLIPADAESSPLTEDGVAARIAKMGSTPFLLDPNDVSVNVGCGLNLPPSAINDVRRRAAEELLSLYAKPLDALVGKDMDGSASGFGEKYKELCKRASSALFANGSLKELDAAREHFKRSLRTAEFFSQKALDDLLTIYPDTYDEMDLYFIPLDDYIKLSPDWHEFNIGVSVPPIIMESEWDSVRTKLKAARAQGLRLALISNISHLSLVSEVGVTAIGGFRLNVTNSESKRLFAELGVPELILSPELTLPQARDIGGAVITLGRIPLMITERCFMKDIGGCDKCGKIALEDRRGARFPMLRTADHRNVILNSAPTYMGDKKKELLSAGIVHEHFIISSETVREAASLIFSYRDGEPLGTPHRRIGKRN